MRNLINALRKILKTFLFFLRITYDNIRIFKEARQENPEALIRAKDKSIRKISEEFNTTYATVYCWPKGIHETETDDLRKLRSDFELHNRQFTYPSAIPSHTIIATAAGLQELSKEVVSIYINTKR